MSSVYVLPVTKCNMEIQRRSMKNNTIIYFTSAANGLMMYLNTLMLY